MTLIFPHEPPEWCAGDLAYCTRKRTDAEPQLERGRVYRVSRAVKPSNIAHHGLQIEGVTAHNDLNGFWSNSFIKLPRVGRLKAIDSATEYTMEHYWNGKTGGETTPQITDS